eukprot:244608-Prorocentrum_minimum.AAC.3
MSNTRTTFSKGPGACVFEVLAKHVRIPMTVVALLIALSNELPAKSLSRECSFRDDTRDAGGESLHLCQARVVEEDAIMKLPPQMITGQVSETRPRR